MAVEQFAYIGGDNLSTMIESDLYNLQKLFTFAAQFILLL
jgi:uncharacterized membrane protein